MSAIYDNWERLVAAVLKRQQLWELFHELSRSPSILSESSDFSSSSRLSTHWQQTEHVVVAQPEEARPKLVLAWGFSPAFFAEDASMASAEFLGRGTSGSAYVALMESGVKFVVKRLKPLSISEPEFRRRMEIIGNVRHENVAALRAYYCSRDERLVLCDYYSEGSVFRLLHGEFGFHPNHLDWETRLRIAIGAARGIAEVHKQNGGKLVHGNVKSSNVFLNPQNCACVSDLGLISMVAAKLMPDAWCYAPEVKDTQNVSQASDVYSFGILLLELLTRKSPGGPRAVNLVKLVSSAKSKERIAKVFDADLLNRPFIRGDMVKLLQIGISCAAKSPKKRPKMSQVVKMLESLTAISIGGGTTSEQNHVFFDNGIPIFSLEDMSRANSEVFEEGNFGISYFLLLQNGSTIRMKRLNGIAVKFKDFQHQMEVIKSMRHENVAELRAYFFHGGHMFLVYDYQFEDSLNALLHGNRGTGRRPLDWEARLRIAVGAARGIAHIHSQNAGKLVHGNVKSSNIFLNGQRCGLVSDAGLAGVSSPVSQSHMRTLGHRAPEVKHTGNASQASDVYSFGAVLLELLSRRPAEFFVTYHKDISLITWIQSALCDQQVAAYVLDAELQRYQTEQESIMQLLLIARDCVAGAPERRPKMTQVVKMLEEITRIDSTREQPFVKSGSVDPQPSTGSSLEEVLEDLLPRLTL